MDVRIIAATNRDLQRAVQKGTFRQDLYYHLNVFPVVVPPLRERREEISLLATHFVCEYAHKLQRPEPSLSAEVLAHLQGYAWPGNVRELAHWMQRAVIVCEGERIEVADVLAAERIGLAWSSSASSASAVPVTQEAKKKDEKRPMAERPDEKQRIVAALRKTNWMVPGNRGAARFWI